ncbi:MAG: tripartite tricarboxylate transporter permease [Lachnospiraceae bacterium]|nr:tripartite tricarboxylate transporter permease [Lachnospiraceae bacterium]
MDIVLQGFRTVLQPQYLIYMFGGVALGLFIGFLPGLSGGMGIGLMLPFTFHMQPLTALVFLCSIYTGGIFGGAVTAILLNTPGAPANLSTVLDGYPMARNGQPERAMGISLMSSTIGGLVGTIVLILLAGPLASFSLKFGPGEMFFVAIFGLTIVGSLADNVLKGVFSGLFGILLGTIGTNTNGIVRGTMGSVFLMDGIPEIPALLGLLALPAIYELAGRKKAVLQVDSMSKGMGTLKGLLQGFKDTLKRIVQSLLCSILGVIVGIIPAAGSTIAGMLGYNWSKNLSKNGDKFGTGVPEGIVGPESANNASEGGALATMFVLGIPGSTATAMMLGALALQGWAVGPKMFVDHADVIYTAFSSLFCQQFVMLLLGVCLCLLGARLIKIPVRYLMPVILVFAITGAYSNRYLQFDCFLIVGFSILGYLMKKTGFPPMPMILGLLLGGMADSELLRINQLFDSFWEIFKSPIVVVLALVSLISVFLPFIMKEVKRSRRIYEKQEKH